MKDNLINVVLYGLAQGYNEQIPIYEEMDKLGREQEKILQDDEIDTELLLEIINKRQGLIDKLENLNEKIVHLKEEICQALGMDNFSIAQLKNEISGPGVEKLEEVVARLSSLLLGIKEMDRKNVQNLQKQIKDTAGKLSQVHQTKQVNKAYQSAPAAVDGVFVDYSK